MKAIKKIISAALILAILTASLCSCDLLFGSKSAEEIIAQADALLAENDYTVITSIQYECQDPSKSGDLNSPLIMTEVDGDNFRIAMTLDGESTDNGVIYTYVDGTLYTQLSENGVKTNSTTKMDAVEKEKLTSNYGTIVGIKDFENVDAKSIGKNGMITCTGIKNETIGEMTDFLEAQLDLDGATVAVKEAVLVITTLSGMYVASVFTCQYVVTTATDAYTLTMAYATAYTYGTDINITAPDFN